MVDLHGCSCKLPEGELNGLLGGYERGNYEDILGPGDDAAVIKINEDLALIKTVDFFTPIVDDAYTQGRIAACNSTNDIFAMGTTKIAGVLVILGIPRQLDLTTAREMLRGFNDFCNEIDAPVVGGHTIINPWPIIGGAVTGLGHPDKILYNSGARPGDVLLLTKPLGVQPSMAALRIKDSYRDMLDISFSSDAIEDIVNTATAWMMVSNRAAAQAIEESGANALTDVTGFGLAGHSGLMAQKSGVTIDIHTIPAMKGTFILSNIFGYGLEKGESSETAGGLLISVDKDRKDSLIQSLEKRRVPWYEIGNVREYQSMDLLINNPRLVEIPTGPGVTGEVANHG